MTGAPLLIAVCERLGFRDDQRSFHPCGLVSRHRAVEHVLAGLVDLQVNDAAGRLCQREVDIGLIRRLLVCVLPGPTQVRDVDIRVDLIDREVVEGRFGVLNRDLDNVAHLHFEHAGGEGQSRHVDEEQRVLGRHLKEIRVVRVGHIHVAHVVSVCVTVIMVICVTVIVIVGRVGRVTVVVRVGVCVTVIVRVGRVGSVRRVVNVCGRIACVTGCIVTGT